jgi:Zn-dependent protease
VGGIRDECDHLFLFKSDNPGAVCRTVFTMNSVIRNWSLCIGRWRGAEARIHVLLPLLALTALLVTRKMPTIDLRLVAWSLIVLVASVTLHEVVRIITALRVGGQVSSLVLAPWGGFSRIHLPADPPAHLLTALAGPCVLFVTIVVAACALAFAGDRDVLRLFASPNDPDIAYQFMGANVVTLSMIGQLVVWINACLLLVDLLPIDPCAGAEILRGVLWPVVGRTSALAATSHVAIGMSGFFAVAAALLAKAGTSAGLMPGWYPLAGISVLLLFGGRASGQGRQYDVGLAIDEFDSDDEEWLGAEWEDDDREAVLVEHLQDKQQEALDRKRREQEANEDARVDDILARLHETGLEKLSEEDRAFLKRASRRYQQRRGNNDNG